MKIDQIRIIDLNKFSRIIYQVSNYYKFKVSILLKVYKHKNIFLS
jgi:hypothetical protein